jgi:hypothetical protein
MHADQTAQFLFGGRGPTDRISEPFENLARFVLVELDQNVVLVLEIEIDGSVSHPGRFGDLSDRRLKKPLIGEHLDGGFKNALVLVTVLGFRSDGGPPGDTMNEYSFIYQRLKVPVKPKRGHVQRRDTAATMRILDISQGMEEAVRVNPPDRQEGLTRADRQ